MVGGSTGSSTSRLAAGRKTWPNRNLFGRHGSDKQFIKCCKFQQLYKNCVPHFTVVDCYYVHLNIISITATLPFAVLYAIVMLK